MVRFLCLERYFSIYVCGIKYSIIPPMINPKRIAHQISLRYSIKAIKNGCKIEIKLLIISRIIIIIVMI
jgi:hypothetical protein